MPPDVIKRLKNIGCDTAKAVLELSEDELARRSGLEKETAEKIILLMRAEFAEDKAELEEVLEEAAELTGEVEAPSAASAAEPAAEAATEPARLPDADEEETATEREG
jgi:transcription termination/antitermination protein NusA